MDHQANEPLNNELTNEKARVSRSLAFQQAATAIRQLFTPLGFKGKTPPKVRCHTPSRFELRLQRFLAWTMVLPFSGTLVLLMKYKARYRIDNLEQARAQFQELL